MDGSFLSVRATSYFYLYRFPLESLDSDIVNLFFFYIFFYNF